MKTKWRILFMAFWLLHIAVSVLAQQTGVYLTQHDFDRYHVSYSRKANLKYHFKLNDFFNSKYLKIQIGDSSYKIHKDSVYGYRDKENISYRFFTGKAYEILNPSESILLYSYTSLKNNKGFQTITNYFFSSCSNAEILPLTKINLKKTFSTNNHFHELLDMYFNSDAELTAYDDFYQIYKLNKIYQLKQ